jgi:hypothetical protein
MCVEIELERQSSSKMDTLDMNDVHILDLPNEMLLAIFEKLKAVHTIFSLVDVNQRLDQLILDPLYSRHLDFTEKSSTGCVCPMVELVLDRICEKVLPRIHLNVKKLTVEPLSMERILLASKYPELHSLSLVNFEHASLLHHLRGIQLNLVKNILKSSFP